MACKNNKRNRRRVAYYHINKFDYEAREKLAEGQSPPKETYSDEKAKVVELRQDYTWNEFWAQLSLSKQSLERLRSTYVNTSKVLRREQT